mgnify:CR=1 FL=1
MSVFGWRPDAVILQTGREGEAWELIFDGSAKFEQRRIEHPLEGTSVLLLKRGTRSEVLEVVGEVGQALRRWCRYCPIEVLFEDLFHGASPERISVGWRKGDAMGDDMLDKERSSGSGDSIGVEWPSASRVGSRLGWKHSTQI